MNSRKASSRAHNPPIGGEQQQPGAATHASRQTAVDDPRSRRQPLRAAVIWGAVFGIIQAASPLVIRWLDPATVYALSLILIASVYIGFAVADGRPIVIAVESAIAAIFVLVATLGISGPAW
jgi:hypothetical protein